MNDIIHTILNEYYGKNTIINIMKNTEAAPYLGSRFGQDVEPKGTYVLYGHTNIKGWVNGMAVLKKPMYINVDDSSLIEYKRTLSTTYKAKGKKLTEKLMNLGYDSIITVLPNNEYGEIILFQNASFYLN
jgi:hypothetical protein